MNYHTPSYFSSINKTDKAAFFTQRIEISRNYLDFPAQKKKRAKKVTRRPACLKLFFSRPGRPVTFFFRMITIMKDLEKTLQQMHMPEAAKQDNAYDTLNKEFESLNFELQEANYKLQMKVAELDVITDYLRNILENITQGILFIDLDGAVTTCNKAAETILGIPSNQIIFHRFWDTFKDDTFGFSMHQALQNQKEDNIYSVVYTSPLNHQNELEILTAFVHINDNKHTSYQNQGLIVTIRDVTEVRHLQTMSARADRMKLLGNVVAHVAHEIRNPLGGIKGFATLLKRDLANNPALQDMASHIIDGTDSLNNIVEQILHYTRPVHLHFEQTNLVFLIDQVKQHIIADANIYHPDIEISVKATEEIVLSLDSSHFKSALLNLLVNAIQAMPHGGKISLSILKQPNYVILEISDTGTGIPEELIPKLYSPFFTTKPEGNGLGLVEVQKVIQAHGGTIDVRSVVGQGTTFAIKLPLKYSLKVLHDY
jgi:PAS domain S-box-containing protein